MQSGFVSKADTKPLVMPAADQSIRGQAATGIHGDLKRQMIKVEKAAPLHRGVLTFLRSRRISFPWNSASIS